MNKYELMPIDGRASFYGKAIVKEQEGVKRLYSYNTLVAEVCNGKVTLFKKWDSSATTIRHVRAFLAREGFPAGSKSDIAKQYA